MERNERIEEYEKEIRAEKGISDDVVIDVHEVAEMHRDVFDAFIGCLQKISAIKRTSITDRNEGKEFNIPSSDVIVTDTKHGIGLVMIVDEVEFLDDTWEITCVATHGTTFEVLISLEDAVMTKDSVIIQTYGEHTVSFQLIEVLDIAGVKDITEED